MTPTIPTPCVGRLESTDRGAAAWFHTAPLWVVATVTMLAVGAAFYAGYVGALWAAGLRRDVPSVVFGWESSVPFLAWTVVPYWSINLLYIASFFLCRNRAELRAHAKRLLMAQGLAVAVFVIAPLQYTFTRPPTDGMVKHLFAALESFDKPYNQAPSLHVAFSIILGAFYVSHFRQFRAVVVAWFALVTLSPLTTFQHHFLDLPTGAWLGLLCLVGIRCEPARTATRSRGSRRMALLYGVVAGVLLACAVVFGSWTWWLLWPAGAFGVVSTVYAAGAANVFAKCEGRHPVAVRWLLLPYLWTARLNSWLWARGQSVACEVSDGVWLGRAASRRERSSLGISSIVDLAPELALDVAGQPYRAIAVLDLTLPDFEQLDAAVAAIVALQHARPTLVCCALGYSRSAMAVAAWLVASGRADSAADAIAFLKRLPRKVVLSTAHQARLAEWEGRRRNR